MNKTLNSIKTFKFRRKYWNIFTLVVVYFLINFGGIVLFLMLKDIVIILMIIFYNLPFLVILFFNKKLYLTFIVFDEEYGIKWIYKDQTLYSIAWKDILAVQRFPADFHQSIIFNGDSAKKYCNIDKKKLRKIIEICPLVELKQKMKKIKLFV